MPGLRGGVEGDGAGSDGGDGEDIGGNGGSGVGGAEEGDGGGGGGSVWGVSGGDGEWGWGCEEHGVCAQVSWVLHMAVADGEEILPSVQKSPRSHGPIPQSLNSLWGVFKIVWEADIFLFCFKI